MRTDCQPQSRPKLYRYGAWVISVAANGDGESRFLPIDTAIGRSRGIAPMPKRLRAELRRLPLAKEL